MSADFALRATDLSEAQRAALADWQAQLGKLVTQQRICRARAVHGELGRHLSSALRSAHTAIAEACAPAASKLLSAAAETIAPYFRHPGDARQVAAKFDAFAELHGFLRAWRGEQTLSGLGDQAEATADLIARLLAGKIIWQWDTCK